MSRSYSKRFILYNVRRFQTSRLGSKCLREIPRFVRNDGRERVRGFHGQSCPRRRQEGDREPPRAAPPPRESVLRAGRAGNLGRGVRPDDEPVERAGGGASGTG